MRPQILDGSCRVCVQLAGLGIGEEVTEIRTHDDEGFRSTPEDIQDLGDFFRQSLTHHQGNQLEVVENHLEEGEMNLEAVLAFMGLVQEMHPLQSQDLLEGFPIKGNRAQGGFEGSGPRGCQAPKGVTMGWSKENDPTDILTEGGDSDIS